MEKRIKKTILLLVSLICVLNLWGQKKADYQDRVIEVNFTQGKGKLKTAFNECIGAGRANEGLRADWQKQLRQVKEELGFRYIRMHGIFHDDMGVYSEDKNGNPVYNWQYIDELYDFLKSIGIKPFVELSFMPQALASGDKTVFWWKANITPPKSYDKWANLVQSLVEHFTERYGKDEVKTWYFEVWNEPNHGGFWSSDRDEYFKLYDYSAKAVKSVCNEYRVGGPATAGNQWVKETIDHCATGNIPIDFIATHSYASGVRIYKKNGKKEAFLNANPKVNTKQLADINDFGEKGTFLSANPKAIIADATKSRRVIAESKHPELELHYTEWSASFYSTDPFHDTYQNAAFILNKIKGTETTANSMSYWVFTDIFEELGPRFEPFHGGFGLLNYQSIKKPSYFAYQFLNQLGPVELVNNDPSSWLCKNSNGDVQALFWDFTSVNLEESMINQVYYKKDLPSKEKGNILLKFDKLPIGKYLLEIYKTGYRVNDAYSTYFDMGSPLQLSTTQIDVIKKLNSGNPIEKQLITIQPDGKLERTILLHENDVFMVKLTKV
jgi:xylan 1,4-beta-xylosidase